jgi:glycerol-3-phosphate dehydrogenase
VPTGETTPPPEAVDAFLADANATFPRLGAELKDIRMLHHGLTPGEMRGGRLDLLADSRVIDHSARGVAGLLSIVGVKYTTARETAEHAVDLACRALGRPAGKSRTASTPLPHAGIADAEGRLIETLRELGLELDRDILDHLTSWYGTEAPDVARYASSTDNMERLCGASAVHLSDAVLRRTSLGSAGHPGKAALERAADIMAARLGWSAAARAAEIVATDAAYPATARRTP